MIRRKPKPRNAAYETFAQAHACPWCWACGRTEQERPRWYYGPFLIERAHVVSHPRREDIRAVVLLDSVCHKIQHGERFKAWDVPRLTVAHLLTLKLEMDETNFDPVFLRSCSIGNLPDPEPLPDIYRAEYAMRHDRAFMESIRDEIHARGEETRTSDPLPEQLPDETDKAYLARLARRAKGAM